MERNVKNKVRSFTETSVLMTMIIVNNSCEFMNEICHVNNCNEKIKQIHVVGINGTFCDNSFVCNYRSISLWHPQLNSDFLFLSQHC